MSNVVIDTFRLRDVWATRPDWGSDPRESLASNVDVWQMRDDAEAYAHADYATAELRFGYIFWSRTQIADMKDFFDGKLGRLYAFWIPTWREDIVVNSAIAESDSVLSIEDYGYHDYWGQNQYDGRFVMFLFPDGTRIYRKILYSISNTLIVIDPPLGKGCSAADLPNLMVSFLHLVRFGMDELELRFRTPEVCEVDLSFHFVPQETPTTTSTTTTTTSSTSSSSSTFSTVSSSSTSSTASTTSSTASTSSTSSTASTTSSTSSTESTTSTNTQSSTTTTTNTQSSTSSTLSTTSSTASTVSTSSSSSSTTATVPISEGTYYPADSGDDGYLYHTISSWDTGSSEAYFGSFGAGQTLDAFIRFSNVQVPQGATIVTATLRVKCSETKTNSTLYTRIRAHEADDSAQLSDRTEFLARDWTENYGAYYNENWYSGTWYEADVTSVVQEITDRGGWSPGNHLQLAIFDNGSGNGVYRAFYTFDNGSGYPELYIDWS
jgi:hypothetical protein